MLWRGGAPETREPRVTRLTVMKIEHFLKCPCFLDLNDNKCTSSILNSIVGCTFINSSLFVQNYTQVSSIAIKL